MLQVRGGLDLAEEALGADHRREFGLQHLDGDLALVLEVLGEVDGGHASLPELTLDAVSVGEGGGEAIKRSAHLTPAAAINRFISATQFSTTTGSACTTPEDDFTKTNCLPSADTS